MSIPNHIPNGTHPHALCSLRVIIVGAGIGGLTAAYTLGRAGHLITVLESMSQASATAGAGIQLPPNASRLLIRWGMGERLKEVGVQPQKVTFRRYATGEVVGCQIWGDRPEREYDSPYYHVHRADLHRCLLDLATPYMILRVNSKVVSVNPSKPSVTLASGEVLEADLIIGADGVGSRLRDVVVGQPDKPIQTGDAAYRAVISTETMMDDWELRALVEEQGTNIWMGPGRHVVTYCICDRKQFNIVMIHPDRRPAGNEMTRDADCDVMREDFAEFEPRVKKLLGLISGTQVWSLMDREPLPSWVHREGRVCLLGDACHPTLPYRAQGAAMAIEDAAVLGALFAKLRSQEQALTLLQIYQFIRLPRTSETQKASRMNQHIFHLRDGPDQQARDKSMGEATKVALKELKGKSTADCTGSTNLWADKAGTAKVFGYDAEEDVFRWCKTNQGWLTGFPEKLI